MLENVAIQWLIRRVPEWSGLLVTLVTLYGTIPPEHKDTLQAILTGQGGGLTVAAVIGLALWVYAQAISFRQTTKPKSVEKVGGKSVEVSQPRKTLWQVLTGK